MVEDPPVGVHVGARHGGDLLADASAGQAGRALQQPQYRERRVADEEVSLRFSSYFYQLVISKVYCTL